MGGGNIAGSGADNERARPPAADFPRVLPHGLQSAPLTTLPGDGPPCGVRRRAGLRLKRASDRMSIVLRERATHARVAAPHWRRPLLQHSARRSPRRRQRSLHRPQNYRPRSPAPMPPRTRWRWADLLHRVFAVDVLACPRCGGRMRILATIDDPRVVRRILAHLGLISDAGPQPDPPTWRAARAPTPRSARSLLP